LDGLLGKDLLAKARNKELRNEKKLLGQIFEGIEKLKCNCFLRTWKFQRMSFKSCK